MHLSLEDLLGLRDGAPPQGAAEHVAGCPHCAAELADLRTLAERLRALPPSWVEHDGWGPLRSALQMARGRRRLVRAGWAAAGLAAAMSLAVLVRGAVETVRDVRLAQSTRALVAESQDLETRLHASHAGVVSGRTASAIIALEDSIALIDARLALRGENQPEGEDVVELWQERVRLLDALVGVQESGVTYVGL